VLATPPLQGTSGPLVGDSFELTSTLAVPTPEPPKKFIATSRPSTHLKLENDGGDSYESEVCSIVAKRQCTPSALHKSQVGSAQSPERASERQAMPTTVHLKPRAVQSRKSENHRTLSNLALEYLPDGIGFVESMPAACTPLRPCSEGRMSTLAPTRARIMATRRDPDAALPAFDLGDDWSSSGDGMSTPPSAVSRRLQLAHRCLTSDAPGASDAKA